MLEIALLKKNELESQSNLHASIIVQIEGSKKKVVLHGKKKQKGQVKKIDDIKSLKGGLF
jgi:hypothetical protein